MVEYMTTQKAFATYQEVIDLHTESDTVSVVGVRTPSDSTPQRMLGGFFRQFKKFKYMGASLSMVPAARLPADPLQVSYQAGEPTIDPRDMLNPILWHGCHGNDMGSILNQFYSGVNAVSGNNRLFIHQTTGSTDYWQGDLPTTQVGADALEALYYRALTDNTWAKAHPQRGFRKSGLRPMVYSLASNMQLLPKPYATGTGISPRDPESHIGDFIDGTQSQNSYPGNGANGTVSQGTVGAGVSGQGQAATNLTVGNMPGPGYTTVSGAVYEEHPMNRSGLAFFTPRLTPLGWMDTRQPIGGWSQTSVQSENLDGSSDDAYRIARMYNYIDSVNWTRVPKVYMGLIMLPPAYKTEQYFRLVINHRFGFAGFRGQSMLSESDADAVRAPAKWDLI